MSTSVLYMSMSLDGYIAGPNDDVDNPGGEGFMRLMSGTGLKNHLPTRRERAGEHIS